MNRIDITALLAALLALVSIGQIWGLSREAPGLDFYQFWVGAQVAGRSDLDDFYSEESADRLGAEYLQRALVEGGSERRIAMAQRRRHLEFYSTPFLYSMFRLFVSGSYESDLWRYQAVSLGCGAGALLVLGTLYRFPAAATWLVVVLCTIGFQPLRSDVRATNVNQIQLAWLAAFLWLQGRGTPRSQWLAGASLGLLTAFKPNTAVIVFLLCIAWLLERRFEELKRQISGMVVGGALAGVIGSLYFGSLESWHHWLRKISQIPSEILRLDFGNFGLIRLVQETQGISLALPMTMVLVLIALAVLWVSRGEMASADRETLWLRDALVVGLGTLITFLMAPLVWQHYLVLVIPGILALWCPRLHGVGKRPQMRTLLSILGWAAVAITPWTTFVGMGTLPRQALVVNGGLVLLLAVTIWARLDLHRAGSDPDLPAPREVA